MRYPNSILLPFVFFLASCSDQAASSGSKYAVETKQFNNYLQQQFSTEIPDDSCNYVLIASGGCNGCASSFMRLLMKPVKGTKVKYIVPGKLLLKREMENYPFDNFVMVDTGNRVDRLPWHKGNIAVMQTVNRELYNYYVVEPYQTDSVIRLLTRP